MSFWIMTVAMNAVLFVGPIYCVARAFSDIRNKRKVWAVLGGVSAVLPIALLLATFAFPGSDIAVALMFSSGPFAYPIVLLYAVSRTIRDVLDHNIWWTISGCVCIFLIIRPLVWTLV